MDKISQIQHIAKKNPTWIKVFLLWLEQDEHLNVSQLASSFTTLMLNKQLINKDVNTDYALSLLDHKDDTGRCLVEKLDDKIQEVLHLKKKEQFISSLKTLKYANLFDSSVHKEIHVILDNNISISSLKSQFFNKIASFKNSNELLMSLLEYKNKNISWNKEYYIKRIKDNSLKASIVSSENNKLMIQVHDYTACRLLGSQSWCIVQKEYFYNQYTNGLSRQFIYLDFDKDIDIQESLIGFTVDLNGCVHSSYLKNDKETPHEIRESFFFMKMNKTMIRKHLNGLSHQNAFISICKEGLVDFFHEFLAKKGVDPSFNNSCAIAEALNNSNFDIFKLLINDAGLDPLGNNNFACNMAVSKGMIPLMEFLLKDSNFNPGYDNNWAIRNAVRIGDPYIIKLLLEDSRVTPSDLNGSALIQLISFKKLDMLKTFLDNPRTDPTVKDHWIFRYSVEHGFVEAVKLLLKDPRIDPSACNNEAIRSSVENGDIEMFKILLNDPRVNPSDLCNAAIQASTRNGFIEMTNLLLDDNRVDPRANDNYPIRISALKNNIEMSQLLFDDNRVDPSTMDNYILKQACANQQNEIIELFLKHDKVVSSLTNSWIKTNIEISHHDVLYSSIN
jgi:hypothetical protein